MLSLPLFLGKQKLYIKELKKSPKFLMIFLRGHKTGFWRWANTLPNIFSGNHNQYQALKKSMGLPWLNIMLIKSDDLVLEFLRNTERFL